MTQKSPATYIKQDMCVGLRLAFFLLFTTFVLFGLSFVFVSFFFVFLVVVLILCFYESKKLVVNILYDQLRWWDLCSSVVHFRMVAGRWF